MSLLPGNATPLERQAGQALAQIQRVPVPIRHLLDPARCPLALLPYLAWAFSVDRWDSRWPEAAKRAAIRASWFIHAHKGTLGALRRVVEPLGYLIEVVEWFETEPPGVPGTFALKIGVLDEGITEAMYQELSWLIDDAKPLTRHLTGLAITLSTNGRVRIGAALCDGDALSIYPPAQRDIEVGGVIAGGGRTHSIDALDIHP
ncbi:phage tail protein I [Pseudomonas cremoricolorata]|uniref:phage tail protein I n=1 Tax=Pseudomonas cremoricolorata TaxID=157783 RepID=UPI0004206901|nr:phage tail protein I [Pseudomonas cremoricolorata]